jgi:hypothetical protein
MPDFSLLLKLLREVSNSSSVPLVVGNLTYLYHRTSFVVSERRISLGIPRNRTIRLVLSLKFQKPTPLPMTSRRRGTQDMDAQAFPLHRSIVEVNAPGIEQQIQASYDVDPSSIRKPDPNGFTPIYCSLGCINLYALPKLIDLGATEDLGNYRNTEGLNPHEKLLDGMRSNREFSETLLGLWNGHEKTEVLAEYLAKRAFREIGTVTESEFEANAKWGCTCGVC